MAFKVYYIFVKDLMYVMLDPIFDNLIILIPFNAGKVKVGDLMVSLDLGLLESFLLHQGIKVLLLCDFPQRSGSLNISEVNRKKSVTSTFYHSYFG